jgi:hypothetical protein
LSQHSDLSREESISSNDLLHERSLKDFAADTHAQQRSFNMAESSIEASASLPRLAEAKLQRQNERIRQADAALSAAPMERQRSDSNSKVKNVKNLNLAIDATSRRASSQDIDTPVVVPPSGMTNNDSQPQLHASQLSRSLSAASRITSSSRNDDQNNSIQLHNNLEHDGFQVVYSRKSRRTLSINNSTATAPPKTATVEGHVAPLEISAVFGNALPGTSFLASNMGRSSGQLQFIQHPNGDVSAHIWSGSRMQWENVGQFSNIRRRIEGQLAVCRLKGETANQMRRQNTLAYFRAVARQKEAELLGASFGVAEIKALLPDPVSSMNGPSSVANTTSSSRRMRSTTASRADDPFLRSTSRHPVSKWTPAVPAPSTHNFVSNAAPLSSLVTQAARDTVPRVGFADRKGEEVFLPNAATRFVRSSHSHLSAASSEPHVTLPVAATNTTTGHNSFTGVVRQSGSSSLFDLGLVPQKPTIDKSSPAALFFESLKLTTPAPHGPPSAPASDSRNVADGTSFSLPQTSVVMPDAHARGALRGQLIRLGESAKGRSVSSTPASKLATQEQSLATQASPARTPFRTVLHDPYRTEQPTAPNEAANTSVPAGASSALFHATLPGKSLRQLLRDKTAESGYFPLYTQPSTSAATQSSSRPGSVVDNVMTYRSQNAIPEFDPFLPKWDDRNENVQVLLSSAIDRRPLPTNTFDLRGSVFPVEESSGVRLGARTASSEIDEPHMTSSARVDHTSLLQARHEYSADPTFRSMQPGNANNLTGWKAYDDRLCNWWNGDNKFQRQEDFYQRIKAAHRISSPNSTKKQASDGATSHNRSSPAEDSTQFNGPLTRVLIPVFENLEAYSHPSINAAPDYWCPWASSRTSTSRHSSAPLFSAIDSPLQTYSTAIPSAMPTFPSEPIGRVPEWAIDRGPKGNESFWDVQEWGMPPARVGRDTRYSSSGSGTGGFAMAGGGIGRVFAPPSSVSSSPVMSRGLGRMGGR